nr:hypothetical protein [Pseudoclavibacter sp. RFBB5]
MCEVNLGRVQAASLPIVSGQTTRAQPFKLAAIIARGRLSEPWGAGRLAFNRAAGRSEGLERLHEQLALLGSCDEATPHRPVRGMPNPQTAIARDRLRARFRPVRIEERNPRGRLHAQFLRRCRHRGFQVGALSIDAIRVGADRRHALRRRNKLRLRNVDVRWFSANCGGLQPLHDHERLCNGNARRGQRSGNRWTCRQQRFSSERPARAGRFGELYEHSRVSPLHAKQMLQQLCERREPGRSRERVRHRRLLVTSQRFPGDLHERRIQSAPTPCELADHNRDLRREQARDLAG